MDSKHGFFWFIFGFFVAFNFNFVCAINHVYKMILPFGGAPNSRLDTGPTSSCQTGRRARCRLPGPGQLDGYRSGRRDQGSRDLGSRDLGLRDLGGPGPRDSGPSASELSVYGVPPLSVCSCLTNFRRIRSGQTRFLHCVSCVFVLRNAFCARYAQVRRIRSSVFGNRVLSYLSVSSGHNFAGYAQIQPDTLRF